MTDKKVWLITGASSGIGRDLADEALAQGYRVVATARRPAVLQGLLERHPGTASITKVDVTIPSDIVAAVRATLDRFGRIDVVVNNAGYGLVGAVEEPSDEQIRRQFETNLFGVVNVVRATLPTLRSQRSGHYINISSCLGFFASPSYGYYSATKFALQGLSEALALETAPLGLKVTIAEPGATRTDFVGRGIDRPAAPLPDSYPSTDALLDHLARTDGKQLGDPREIARILIGAAELDEPPLHLPLGDDSFEAIARRLEHVAAQISLARTTFPATRSRSVDES